MKAITFMIAFNQIFSEETFYTLKKLHKNSGVNPNIFLKFIEFTGGDIGITRKFINHQLSISGDYVKEKFNIKDGPELGAKIKELENIKFFNSL